MKFTISVLKRCNIPNLVKQRTEDDGCQPIAKGQLTGSYEALRKFVSVCIIHEVFCCLLKSNQCNVITEGYSFRTAMIHIKNIYLTCYYEIYKVNTKSKTSNLHVIDIILSFKCIDFFHCAKRRCVYHYS